MIGQTVSHYRILEECGSGGMGVVFKAEDTKLGRLVALKFLPEDVIENRQALERFLLEARTAASLSHPHICTIHEIDEHEGIPFIAMEYLEGNTLREVISGEPLAVETVVDLGIQIAEALAVAHAKGVTHRDIKPSNIFVTEGGKAKVLDFGLAKPGPRIEAQVEDETIGQEAPTQVADLTTEGTALGTVAYMSPEQALGQELDARSDLFSLGAVLYEMVTGRQAFSGTTQAAVFDKILHHSPPAPVRLGVEVPFELEQTVNKALEKNRLLRYQSALEVQTDLTRVRRDLESGRSAAVVLDPSGDAAAARPPVAEASGRSSAIGLPDREKGSRRWLWLSLGTLVFVVAAIAGFLLGHRGVTVLTEGDLLLLTDFVNTTDDPVFDGALKQALAVKLEESPYLNIVPERQVQETLRFMNRSADERLTPEVGHEVCERQGVKAMVTGTIAPLGSHYVVTLNAVECRGGESLARQQVEATSKEEVLAGVGSAAANMRRELGESLASIEMFDAPVENATTSSLEALKVFSIGEQKRARGEEEEAIPFFKRALDLDPDFALAYGRLGSIHSNLKEWDSALEYKQKAFELRHRVSEREELYITAHYYGDVTGEIDKQIEAYELFKQTYPHEWTPANNLADLYLEMGDFEKAADEAQLAVRLNPDHPFPHENLVRAYMALDRLEEAEAVLDEAIGRGFVHYTLFVRRYELAFLKGDREAMDRQLESVAGKPGEAWMLDAEAATAASRGEVERARELTRRAVDVAQRHGFRDQSAFFTAAGAASEAAFGNLDLAREQAAAAVEIARNRDSMSLAAFVLARAGAAGEAREIITELAERFPTDTLMNRVSLSLARAGIELERGDSAAAVELLEAAEPFERASPRVVYLRAQAYLLAGEGSEAAKELEKLLQLRGVAPTSAVHTLVRLGQARAYALQGRSGESRAAYESFLALLESADKTLPVLEEARKELASLS